MGRRELGGRLAKHLRLSMSAEVTQSKRQDLLVPEPIERSELASEHASGDIIDTISSPAITTVFGPPVMAKGFRQRRHAATRTEYKQFALAERQIS